MARFEIRKKNHCEEDIFDHSFNSVPPCGKGELKLLWVFQKREGRRRFFIFVVGLCKKGGKNVSGGGGGLGWLLPKLQYSIFPFLFLMHGSTQL